MNGRGAWTVCSATNSGRDGRKVRSVVADWSVPGIARLTRHFKVGLTLSGQPDLVG